MEIDEKLEIGNKAEKTPSKSSHEVNYLRGQSPNQGSARIRFYTSFNKASKKKKKKRYIQKIPRRWILNP